MKRYYFSGIVHPERAQIDISNLTNKFYDATGNVYAEVKFNIAKNQITAIIDSNKENIYTLRNIVKNTLELITSVVGYVKGYAYDIEIAKCFDDELDITSIFGIAIPSIEERNQNIDLIKAATNIYNLCQKEEGVFLRRCLTDLNLAMKHADDTPFYCFRAIESLKQYCGFKFNLQSDRDQWERLSTLIGVERCEIEPVREFAFPARHGIPEPLSDEQRRDIFMVTWNIVDEFINYRLEEVGVDYRIESKSE